MLESLEGFFGAPALVVKVGKQTVGGVLGRQVGRHHAGLPIGGCLAHQAKRTRGAAGEQSQSRAPWALGGLQLTKIARAVRCA